MYVNSKIYSLCFTDNISSFLQFLYETQIILKMFLFQEFTGKSTTVVLDLILPNIVGMTNNRFFASHQLRLKRKF